MLVFFSNLSLMEFLVKFLASLYLFAVIDGLELFWMGHLPGISISILDPKLFLQYINERSDYVICNIAIYADDTALLFYK